MNILFVHQNFPSQYKHLAPVLAAKGHRVIALTINAAQKVNGVTIIQYKPKQGTSVAIHRLAADFETKIIRAEAAGFAALELRNKGFNPDIICAHPGWGEALFLKDVWPNAKLLCYWEFYYHAFGADVNFDPEFQDASFDNLARIRLKNANNLLTMEVADAGISPTEWQRTQFPVSVQDSIAVIHDGIDTGIVRPNPEAYVRIEQLQLNLVVGDEIITFVNRNLEPYRGFHTFIRALPELLKRRPNARVIIVGNDAVSYGAPLPDKQTYKQKYLAELQGQLDLSRIHFAGNVPYGVYLSLLQVSAVHVYLTVPFVLSWSMLEAMSAGCLVVGSATAPVEEVIQDGVNGLLTPFSSSCALADKIDEALSLAPVVRQTIKTNARNTIIERYDLHSICLPKQTALIENL